MACRLTFSSIGTVSREEDRREGGERKRVRKGGILVGTDSNWQSDSRAGDRGSRVKLFREKKKKRKREKERK